MTTERLFLWLALVFYATSLLLTARRLQLGVASSGLQRVNSAAVLAGFVLQTLFLYYRGQALHRCPLTNTFEITAFIAWAATLFYLLIGPSYRLSFLGAFTSPLVLALCLISLLVFPDRHPAEAASRSAWVEFHGAIAILAYGAFALAFVVSGMYLNQERQLKTRHLGRSFLLLPPIEQLDTINFRLLIMGFGMFTVAMIGGFVSYEIIGHATRMKVPYAVAAWCLYAVLLGARWLASWRGRRVAIGTMAAFTLVLVAYWGLKW